MVGQLDAADEVDRHTLAMRDDMAQMAHIEPEAQAGGQGQCGKKYKTEVIWVHGWRPAVPKCATQENRLRKIMAQDQNALVWLDMEMTGLNPDGDHIIELALVVTN